MRNPVLRKTTHARHPQRLQTESGSRPLNICLLSYRSDPHCGGQGVYVRNLSKALIELGHRVEVLSGPPVPALDNGVKIHGLTGLDLYNPQNPFRTPAINELKDPINLVEWLGVSSMGFPEPYTFGLRALKFLKINHQRYDIVHDNQSLSYGVREISRHIPTIATIHHPLTVDRDIAVRSTTSLWKKLKEIRWYSFIGMQKRVSRSLSHIVAVSRFSGRDVCKAYRIPHHRLRIVPNGIDTRLFYPLPGIAREKNHIIVTSSANTPLKGLDYLLRAIADVALKRSVHLVVVGTPDKNGAFGNLVAALGIEKYVTFTGRIHQRDLVRHYARASVAVIPSIYEGFGLPAGEAMACGIPIVSTTGGALPEVLGNTGLLVPPADHLALSLAIQQLLDNPSLAATLGQAGYRRVQREFSWQKAAERTVAVYREAINAYR